LGGCTDDYAKPERIYEEIQHRLKRIEEEEDWDGLEDSEYNCLTDDCHSRLRPPV
jgi:hypothetical protein